MGLFAKSAWLGVAALAAAGLAAPAAAQLHSDGYKFLEAVDKKENNTVFTMLDSPGGSVLVNSRDLASDRTALHIVVARHDEAWLRFLLARGADPNLADNKGVTPLLLACRMGFLSGVEALVSARARVDESNDAGETPLISAVHVHNLELVKILLKAGADPDHTDNSGRSARDYAKLDGAQSTVLAAIVQLGKTKASARADTYGPSL
ncbi:MAG: ankyrin repeat domain-containing protein [Croceibacterium sp.]